MATIETLAHIKATMDKAGEPLSDLQYNFLCGYLMTEESVIVDALRTSCHLLAAGDMDTQTQIFLANVEVMIGNLNPKVQ